MAINIGTLAKMLPGWSVVEADKINADYLVAGDILTIEGYSRMAWKTRINKALRKPRPENTPEWATFIAMDGDGEWFAYEEQPTWSTLHSEWDGPGEQKNMNRAEFVPASVDPSATCSQIRTADKRIKMLKTLIADVEFGRADLLDAAATQTHKVVDDLLNGMQDHSERETEIVIRIRHK